MFLLLLPRPAGKGSACLIWACLFVCNPGFVLHRLYLREDPKSRHRLVEGFIIIFLITSSHVEGDI